MKIHTYASWSKILIMGLLIISYGCDDEDDITQPDTMEITYTFDEGPNGWSGHFADYGVAEEELMELGFEHTALPDPLDGDEQALKLIGTNRSDDLFMFVKKKIDGLQPTTRYSVLVSVEFASNVEDNLAGIGGSPGESVFIKVGAATDEPKKIVVTEGGREYYRMNIDKGNQANNGDNAVVIGDFSNDTDESVYTLKTLDNETPLRRITNEKGELWLFVGTDSGFEGTTEIYYNRISVIFEPDLLATEP